MRRNDEWYGGITDFKRVSRCISRAAQFILLIAISNFMTTPFPISSSIAAEAKETEEPTPSLPEYHELNNEDLIQKTQDLFHEAAGGFRAHMRGLQNSALLLEEARTESDNFQIPVMPVLVPDKSSSLETAKLEMDRMKERLTAYQKQLELVETEQKLLNKHIEIIKQTQISAKSFEDTIDALKLPLHEITLRVQDGTLTLEKVPEPLQDYKLTTLREQLARDKQML